MSGANRVNEAAGAICLFEDSNLEAAFRQEVSRRQARKSGAYYIDGLHLNAW